MRIIGDVMHYDLLGFIHIRFIENYILVQTLNASLIFEF